MIIPRFLFAQQSVFKIYHDLPDTNNYATKSVLENNRSFYFLSSWVDKSKIFSNDLDFFKLNLNGKTLINKQYSKKSYAHFSEHSLFYKYKIYSIGVDIDSTFIDKPQFEIYDTNCTLLFDSFYNISFYLWVFYSHV